jgi:hypothetical protein
MTTRAGGLFELVARGKKDLFFTANPVVSRFHSVYIRAAPFTRETYVAKPRNDAEWGRWVDFEIEHRGDILSETYLRIELPTWLPSGAVAASPRGLVTDADGVTFGYCNNVGFQCVSKVQFFNDQIMIHEVYGEYLDWRLRQSYTMSTAFVVAQDVGSRDDSALAIARSASPRTLRVPIPVLGWQHLGDPGLPLVALRNQRFRLRVHFRPLEDIVVASDRRLRPAPWGGKPLRVQATAAGPVDTSMTTLPYSAVKKPCVSLECGYKYVGADVATYLKAGTWHIPFYHVQFQESTIEDNVMTAAATSSVETFRFPILADFIGAVDHMLLGLRSEASTMAGERLVLRSVDDTPFVRTVRLNVANIDRIKAWPVDVLRDVAAYWKQTRGALDAGGGDSGRLQEIYTLAFGGFDFDRPTGTLNFTRAVQPTVFLTLNSVGHDPRNISRKTLALLYARSWNVFQIGGGLGKAMFDDS